MRLAAALIALTIAPLTAYAACPIELAVYSAGDQYGIDFTPNHNAGATVTNSFKLVMPDGIIPGHVQWSEGAARPYGSLLHNCPQGDATGAELDACTLWQGVIYTVDEAGAVGLVPAQGEPAPPQLILSGLGMSMAAAPALAGKTAPETDVFKLSGCQE